MIVLSSAPKRLESSRTRRGDGPCRMALIRIDDGAQVDLSAQEAHRRGRHSLPATVAIAAEAQSEALGLRKLGGRAPGLARVVGASAGGHRMDSLCCGFRPRDLRRLPAGTTRSWRNAGKFVIHGRVLRCCGKLRSTPLGEPDPVVRLFEGNFLGRLSDLAQESRISPQIRCLRSSGQEFQEEVGIMLIEGSQPLRHDLDRSLVGVGLPGRWTGVERLPGSIRVGADRDRRGEQARPCLLRFGGTSEGLPPCPWRWCTAPTPASTVP